MTAYDDIRTATDVAESQHIQVVQMLAEAGDTIAEQAATITGLLAENEELKRALADCEAGHPPDPEPPTGDDLDQLLRPPAGKILLGVERPGNGWTGWVAEAGQAPHIWHEYATSGSTFVSDLTACPAGAIPLINFKPGGSMGLKAYTAIINGNNNAAIDQAADAIKVYGLPMFVAPLHEPENDDSGGADDEYAAAFRHIVTRIRARASNAVFVWNMMGASNHAARYLSGALYPGDEYVDWIGYDPYIRTTVTVDTWPEYLNLGASGSWPGFYAWAAKKAKPIMLAEWGLGSPVVPAVPTSLFSNQQMTVLTSQFPLLQALVYWSEVGEQDYRVTHPNWGNTLLASWVRRPEFQVDISESVK